VILLDGAHLRPVDVAAVARDDERVQLDADARARNEAARETIAALLAAGRPLYGATTGVGALRDRPIPEDQREQFQWNLLRSHAVTAGRALSTEHVRAAMVVRANQLGAGGGGVAPPLLDGLITVLNDGVTPCSRELSSVGTGDLGALSEIALALLGEGKVRFGEEVRDAEPLLGDVRLGLRDALGFISSNALALGQAALLAVDARTLLDAWLAVAAVSFEALDADPIVLDERAQVAWGSSHQAAVATRMRALLSGYTRSERGGDRLVQDPYPFRVLPQVDAVSHGALTALEELLERQLNARGENPLIEEGSAWPNGNFHVAELAAAVDALRAALAQSASLIAARVSMLLEGRFAGLTRFLAPDPGVQSGGMIVEYAAHAAAAEVRSLSMPVGVQSVSASIGVESHASLAATALRRAAEQLDAMRVLSACELVVATRAVRLTGRTPTGSAARELHTAAAMAAPSGGGAPAPDDLADRSFSLDIEDATAVLARWRPPAR
jgi:histidine ammonia-lyase